VCLCVIGLVTTLAGASGANGAADGYGTSATFMNPVSVAVDSHGLVYVGDYTNNLVRVVNPGGLVTTIAFGLAPVGLICESTGAIFVAYYNQNQIEVIPGPSTQPSSVVQTSVVNSYSLTLNGVSKANVVEEMSTAVLAVTAVTFGSIEKAAFCGAVAIICGVSSSDCVVTDVTTTFPVKVTFNVLIVLSSAPDTTAATSANAAITSKLTTSLSSGGKFVSILKAIAQQMGANSLYSAAAMSSGLVSNGFTQVVLKTASPSARPSPSPGERKGKAKSKVAKEPKSPRSNTFKPKAPKTELFKAPRTKLSKPPKADKAHKAGVEKQKKQHGE